VVGVGYTGDGAAVLVQRLQPGVPLADAPANLVSNELLVDAWRQVAVLQSHRIAHRALDSRNIMVDDGATIVGFGSASLDGSDQLLAADVAELAVSTALLVGAERALACASAVVSPETLAAALPLIQSVVLTPRTRRAVKAHPDILDAVREATKTAAGVEKYELTKLHRVTVPGAITAVGSVVLLGYLLNLVANWSDIWGTLREADAVAFVPLVVLITLTYVGGALSLMGAVTIEVPFLRTTEVMFAQSFVNRFTPANAGGMAMRTRYLQRQGSDLTVAVAAVGLTTAASGVAQLFFVGLFFVWGGTSDALGKFSLPSKGTLLSVVVLAGVVGEIIALSGWGRRVVVPLVRRTLDEALSSFRELGRRPGRLTSLFGGALLAKLATIAAFVVSVHAFNVNMGFVQAAALYMVANTVGSAVPTPGGVGGLEAALTAVLLGAGCRGRDRRRDRRAVPGRHLLAADAARLAVVAGCATARHRVSRDRRGLRTSGR
ncbi:MAG: lysylphosphatidylglycerol synthase domain-containing protein, partial [Actinomycetota bacterium]